jgi:hypothetical protein
LETYIERRLALNPLLLHPQGAAPQTFLLRRGPAHTV